MDSRCDINCELHVNGTRLSRRKPGAARERERERERKNRERKEKRRKREEREERKRASHLV